MATSAIFGPYCPEGLMQLVMDRLSLKNDAALAKALDVPPSTISKIRHRRIPMSDSLLLRMHEETGCSIKELKAALGTRPAPRAFFVTSSPRKSGSTQLGVKPVANPQNVLVR